MRTINVVIFLLILSPTFLFCQIDSTKLDSLIVEDSLMIAEPEIFAPPENPIDEKESSIVLQAPPAGWSPEFPSPYRRTELLGLRDQPAFIRYDRADGFLLGLGGNTPAGLLHSMRLQGHFGFGYAFGSHYWQVRGGLLRDFLTRQAPLRFGIEGHIITDTRDGWKMGPGENTAFALVAGIDTRDYYQRRGFSVSLQQFVNPRIGAKVEYRLDNYRSSRREVGWSLFGPKQPFYEVPPVQEGRMSSIVVNVLADYITLRSWNGPQFGIEAQAEFGSMTESFAQYAIDGRVKFTVVPGLLWIGARGRAMSATGDAPPQKLFTLGGFGTLPGYPQNHFTGNRLLLLQTDLLFAPISSIDLRIILSNDFGAVAFADSASGALDGFPGEISSFMYSPGIYIGSPTGNFRLGVAFRTDIFDEPRFVVRFSQPF